MGRDCDICCDGAALLSGAVEEGCRRQDYMRNNKVQIWKLN